MSRSLFFILSVYSCCRVSKSILLILFLKILLLGYNCFQCCVDFCCTTKRISYMNVYVYPLPLVSLTAHPHPTPLGHHRAGAELPVLYGSFLLAICFTHGGCIYVTAPLPVRSTLSFLCTGGTCPFSVSVSLFLPCK